MIICADTDLDEKHAEDFSSLSVLSNKSMHRHLNYIQSEGMLTMCMQVYACVVCACAHDSKSLLVEARTQPG